MALRPKEAAVALGVSERKLRELLPQLPHVRAGGAVLIPVEALREWLRARAEGEAGAAQRAVSEILEGLKDQ